MQPDRDDPATDASGMIRSARQAASRLRDAFHFEPGTLPSIAGYQMVRQIKRGGQAAVYLAIQGSTGRRVAIKVVRAGPFFAAAEQARFRREVAVLAQLRHPHIVTIIDSGHTDGLWYFVMDYVPGEPLDGFVLRTRPRLSDVVELMITIGSAVQAAHQRGIIHRDLKPNNIVIDPDGRPHILDFGLAKLVTDVPSASSAASAMTRTGQFVGTLAWSSPEQAEGLNHLVDVRSDVYALGAVTYQALTGQAPFDHIESPARLFQAVAEQDPPRPSQLDRRIDADLDTIVLKCLAKAPADRYASTAAFVEDLERYLRDLPIAARPPSAAYQLGKLISRHRLVAVLAGLLLAGGMAFAAGMTILYQRAQREADIARAVNDFLLNDILASTSPDFAQGREITMRELLDRAAGRIDRSFEDQPEVKGAVQLTIGRAYFGLGAYAKAENHVRQALSLFEVGYGPEHRKTLEAQLHLVVLLSSMEQDDEARRVVIELHDHCPRLLGASDALCLEAAGERAWYHWHDGEDHAARALMEHTIGLARRALGEEPETYVTLLNRWAISARRWSEPGWSTYVEEAVQIGRRDLGEAHPTTLRATAFLGYWLVEQRHFEPAVELLERTLALQRQVTGDAQYETIDAQFKLALLYTDIDRFDQARVLMEQCREHAASSLGEEHALTLSIEVQLANNLMHQCRFGEALHNSTALLDTYVRKFGNDDALTAHLTDMISLHRAQLGRYAQAEPGYRSALKVMLRHRDFAESHAVSGILRRLMLCLADQGRLDEARQIARQLLERRRKTAELPDASAYMLNSYAQDLLNAEPPDMKDPKLALDVALEAAERSPDSYHYNRFTIARAYAAVGEIAPGIEMVHRALERTTIEDSLGRRQYEDLAAKLHAENGDHEAARRVYLDTLSARQQHFGNDHPDIAMAQQRLAVWLLEHHRGDEAEELLQAALETRRRNLHQDHSLIGYNQVLLGRVRMQQGEIAEARDLIEQGLQQMQNDAYVSFIELREALQVLLRIAQRTHDADAHTYRRRLSDLERQMGLPPPVTTD